MVNRVALEGQLRATPHVATREGLVNYAIGNPSLVKRRGRDGKRGIFSGLGKKVRSEYAGNADARGHNDGGQVEGGSLHLAPVELAEVGRNDEKPPPVPCKALLRTRNVRWAPQVRGSDPTTEVGLQAPDSLLAPRGYSIGSSKVSPLSRTPQRFVSSFPITQPHSNLALLPLQVGACPRSDSSQDLRGGTVTAGGA